MESLGVKVTLYPDVPAVGTVSGFFHAAGSITLTSDGLSETLTLQNGKAAYKWENLSDKEYTVTAAYSGDTNYKEANGH